MSKHTVMVKATALPGLSGRSDYISNPDRQENLVHVFERSHADYKFDEIIKLQEDHCKQQSKYLTNKSKEEGHKLIQGREYMFVLDNSFSLKDLDEVARELANIVEKETGQTLMKIGFHWNAAESNFHAHLILPEYIFDPKTKYGAVEKRNRYYDEQGKLSTKKACIDENGKLKKGCQLVEKGKRKETKTFFNTEKLDLRDKNILVNIKKQFANYMNDEIGYKKYRWDKDPNKLAQQHVGKNLTAEQQAAAKKKNALVVEFNSKVDEYQYNIDKAKELNLELTEEDLKLPQNIRNKIRDEIRDVSEPSADNFKTWETSVSEACEEYETKNRTLAERIALKIKELQDAVIQKVKSIYDNVLSVFRNLNSKKGELLKAKQNEMSINYDYVSLKADTDFEKEIESGIEEADSWKWKAHDIYKSKAEARVSDMNKALEEIGSDSRIKNYSYLKKHKKEIAAEVKEGYERLLDIYYDIYDKVQALQSECDEYDKLLEHVTLELKKEDPAMYYCCFNYVERDYKIKINGIVDYETAASRVQKGLADSYQELFEKATGTSGSAAGGLNNTIEKSISKDTSNISKTIKRKDIER